jgi:ankyrin repeat protein
MVLSAIFRNQYHLVANCIGLGACIDFEGCSTLLFACECFDTEIAQLLLDRGADIDKGHNIESPIPPLLYCCAENRVDMAIMLISYGANVNAIDGDPERTALHYLCRRNDDPPVIDLARLLLAKGARLDVVDHNGNTPVDEAKRWKNKGLLKLFREHDESSSSKSNDSSILGGCRLC